MKNSAVLTSAKPYLPTKRPVNTPYTSAQPRLLRRLVLGRLRTLRHGQLTLVEAHGSRHFGSTEVDNTDLHVTVTVHDPALYRRIALRGSIGVGEAYMAGEWSCDDLTALVRLFILNRPVLDSLEYGPAQLSMWLFKLGHWLRRNSKAGSRANIAAHYDLGNTFYRLFLDNSMMYSCALFETPNQSLEQASQAKLARICQKLQLGPNDHVLEIGTGWGGFALYAAQHYGCRVTTTTISQEQYQLARSRIVQADLQDHIELLCKDYRDLDGQYDKLVSIEMIEAVGHENLNRYFQTCSRLLKNDGMMLLQAITIADQEYQRACREVDFIQKYIFPGGSLPSVTALSQSLTQASDLRIFHLDDIGPHYALTLRHWRQRFLQQLDQVRAQGFSESFIRMWEYYLCYCEAGFSERALGTVQLLLTKPLCRREPVLA